MHLAQDKFLQLLKTHAAILDFGCGSGRDTKYFLEKGYQVTATDGSAELCRMASAFTGIEVKKMLFQELDDLDEKMRKLNNVRKLWEGILDVREVRDVFTGNPIAAKQYDVDHFIPWSFVMNDELWNLMPMDSSLNPSKSNKLPKWDPFFIVFAEKYAAGL